MCKPRKSIDLTLDTPSPYTLKSKTLVQTITVFRKILHGSHHNTLMTQFHPWELIFLVQMISLALCAGIRYDTTALSIQMR